LAEKASIHPTHVGLIERSLRNPSLKVAKKIADALELSLAKMVAEAEQICRK
jgi:transcriptional regulator with XRE-family HTH domain